MDKWRLALGAVLIIGLIFLTSLVAFGKVEEKTSYKLDALISILGACVIIFSNWAWPALRDKDKNDKEPPPDNKV